MGVIIKMILYNELQKTDLFSTAILDALSNFSSGDCEYVFSGYISMSDFISQLAFQYFEWDYMNNVERTTLRQQYEIPDGEAYLRATKTLKRIVSDGEKQLERLGLPDKRDPQLLKNLSSNKLDHLAGRLLPKSYLKAIENYQRNCSIRPIYILFRTGRIKSVKKSSNSVVSCAFKEYSQELLTYSSSDTDWLENAIDIFQMEENAPISLIYQLANYMHKYDISFSNFDTSRMILFSVIRTASGKSLQNNFVCHNHKLFPVLFLDKEMFQEEFNRIIAMLELRSFVVRLLYNDQRLKDFIRTVPQCFLVQYFKERYNLFDLIKFPDDDFLNPKVIRLIRNISSKFLVC